MHFAMPRPLRNRFVHLDLEPDFDDWCRVGSEGRIRPEIIAFCVSSRNCCTTADATSDANAWPTPRSWEMASSVLPASPHGRTAVSHREPARFEAQLLEGTMGPAAASELVAFLRLFRQLPSIDEILLNPANGTGPRGAIRANRRSLPRSAEC